MKKAKLFKIIILILSAVLFAAAAVWLQKSGRAGSGGRNAGNSPEDALQAALGETAKEEQESLGTAVPDLAMPQATAAPEQEPETQQPLDTETSGMNDTSESGRNGGEPADVSFPENIGDIPLHDLYAASGQTVRFYISHPDTAGYTWEYYDMELRQWRLNEHAGEIRDAAGHTGSYADFETPESPAELMVRCSYETTGGRASEIAVLKPLPEKGIKALALADGGITAEAGKYLAACEIKVEVTYDDNTSDVIEGLYGLYFMESEVEEQSSEFVSVDGVLTERKEQTCLNYFRQYRTVPAGEENIILAYIPEEGSSQPQTTGTITGEDREPPEISMVDILSKESIPDTQGDISVTILITADDNVTPYPRLQYAVVQTDRDAAEDEIPSLTAEEDWSSHPKAVAALKSGIPWFICCRDEAGNTAVYKCGEAAEGQTALAEEPEPESDMQAPVIRNIYVEAD